MKTPSSPTSPMKRAAAALLWLGLAGTSAHAFADMLYPEVDDVVQGAMLPDRDAETQGKIRVNCKSCKRNRAPERIQPSRIAGLEFGGTFHSAQEACLSRELLESAKRITKRTYRNRARSGGYCARGVNAHLNGMGLYTGNGADAIDWHALGKLNALGFKNFIGEFPTPDKAPPGAVLVFAGPATDQYLNHKEKIYGYSKVKMKGKKGHKRRAKFRRRSAGNWAGHITIAGESRGKGKRWYYTDARTPEAADGWPYDTKKRRLVGVYLMQSCGPDCSPELKAKCGG